MWITKNLTMFWSFQRQKLNLMPHLYDHTFTVRTIDLFETPFNNTIIKIEFGALSSNYHCLKCVRIRSFSDPYFPAFGLNTEMHSDGIQGDTPYLSVFILNAGKSTDQKNSEYGHFLRSVWQSLFANIINGF